MMMTAEDHHGMMIMSNIANNNSRRRFSTIQLISLSLLSSLILVLTTWKSTTWNFKKHPPLPPSDEDITNTNNDISSTLITSSNSSSNRHRLLLQHSRHSQQQQRTRRRLLHYHGLYTEEQTIANANLVQNLRRSFDEKCNNNGTTSRFGELAITTHGLVTPSVIPNHESPTLPIQKCQYVFLDFGANVGDSLIKLINAGLPVCRRKKHVNSQRPTTDMAAKLNANTGTLILRPDRFNNLIKFVRMELNNAKEKGVVPTNASHFLMPEHFCYYGIEGNPIFTQQLHTLQQRILRMSPRLVRSVHFLTETVGTYNNGPTTLYLDTISSKNNFWGLSIHKDAPDVQNSAQIITSSDDGGTQKVLLKQANVTGINLSTLLQQTVIMHPKSIVIVKMDIEGAKWELLTQAGEDHVLCDYATIGTQISIIVEKHGVPNATFVERFEKSQTKLLKCGVKIYLKQDAGRR